jgi:hypothetical protein
MPMASIIPRKSLCLAALLAAMAPGAARAGAATAALPAPAAASITLEICRLPGSLGENSGPDIDIPAGVTFTADAFDDLVNPDRRADDDPSSLQVVTTAPASLGPDKFCVHAPVKPVGDVQPGAIAAALGRMFVATGGGADSGALDDLYGLLRRGGSS